MITSRTLAPLCLLFCLGFGAEVLGQNGGGTITGTVTDPDNSVFAGAFVQLKNTATGKVSNGVSAGDGTFTFANVAAGMYEVSVNVPGMKPYKKTDVVVQSGQTVRIDARLEDGPSLRTLGEDPATIASVFINRPAPPSGRTPRTSDGKPDLSGMWLGGPAPIGELDMQPWAQALMKERADSNSKDYPPAHCLPSGPVPLLLPGWFKLALSRSLLVMIFEGDTPGFRQVFLDRREHPKDYGPSWLGHSVGKWERDTLVIESVGFNDKGWIDYDGRPHTDKLRVSQRIRRPDLGHLEIQITIDDPGAYSKSWTVTKGATLAPDQEIQEYICNENNQYPAHAVGK